MIEVEIRLNEITSFPQYPTIGKILKDIADVAGYTEMEYAPKRSFRKLLQRLDKQDVGKIDLDSYQDFLLTVLNRYKDVTNSFKFFWIDEAQVFHQFNAYQELMKAIPMFVIDQKAINNIVGIFFLTRTIRRYVRWVQVDSSNFQDYTALWVLESLKAQNGLKAVFKNLKKHLGNENMSDWVLVGQIIPEKVYVEKHVRPKYACRNCECSGDEEEEKPVFRVASPPPSLIPGSIMCTSLYLISFQF